jgi:hypothetical protein
MSSVNYLFGNVDNKGNLEQDEQNKDLIQLLDSRETAEYLNKVLSTPFEFKESKFGAGEDDVQPAQDAVDYTDIQEMVEDMAPPQVIKPYFFKQTFTPVQPTKRAPVFSGRLKFSEIFQTHVDQESQQFRLKPIPLSNTEGYVLENDELELFQTPMNARFGKITMVGTISKEIDATNVDDVEMENPNIQSLENENSTDDTIELLEKDDVEVALSSVVLDHWEEKILWNFEISKTNGAPQQLYCFY